MTWIIGWSCLALIAGGVVGIAWLHDPRDAAAAWLVAWGWCFTIAAGALGLDLLLEACGADWQVAMRRPLEALQVPLAMLAVLFVPLALSAGLLYPWAAAGAPVAKWAGRSVGYLALLLAIVVILRKVAPGRRRAFACAALPVYALALTGASWDWFMSLDVRFASTVYGAWVWAGGALAACGAWTVLVVVRKPERLSPLKVDHLVALGRLMLAFTLLAAYLDFSQLVVAWMADLPPEAAWYRLRLEGVWGLIGAAVALGGYALSFIMLLSLPLKRRGWALALVGGWIACWHHTDLAWWLVPSWSPGRVPLRWACLDLAAGVAIGAAAIACVLASLRRAPQPDAGPRLAASLAYRAEIAG